MENDIFHFKVGHFECLAIRDGAADDWNRNVLLIQTGEYRVLVDPGNGRDLVPKGFLLERLQAVGISSTEIDLVILSHADWDHIGGAVAESGEIPFPRARYLLARPEWDFWSSGVERLQPSEAYDEEFRQLAQQVPERRLAHLRDQLELIEPGTEIVPGIRSIAAPGHTPGYTVIEVSSGEAQLLFIGDLLYDPKDLETPEGYSVYDFDPGQVVVTRRRLFEQAAREATLLLAYHLPFPGLGYIVPHGTGWRWRAFELSE